MRGLTRQTTPLLWSTRTVQPVLHSGQTPQELSIDADEFYQLTFEKDGFEPWEREVHVVPGRKATARAKLGREALRLRVDADVYGPSVPMMLGVTGRPRVTDDKRIIPLEKYGLRLMSVGFFLDDDAPVGMPLADYIGDAVLDISIAPNMARNANVIGVARELSAITGRPLIQPDIAYLYHFARREEPGDRWRLAGPNPLQHQVRHQQPGASVAVHPGGFDVQHAGRQRGAREGAP